MCFKRKNKVEKNDVIYDLLEKARNNQQGICISLTGEWGVGKTHRWEHNIKQYFEESEVVYISGFGKTELSEFKLELLDKLLKNKSRASKFLIGSAIVAISTFIIGGVVFNIAGGVENRHWFWITLGVIVGISLLGAIFCYASLVKYFSNKILGVDHNNIDFKRVWKTAKKPILCFDDLERIAGADCSHSVLGFIEELKNLGYSILLIINPVENITEPWRKFKEKVVNRTFIQLPVKETFNSVISKYQLLDETEKVYLETIFDLWSKINKNEEQWDKKDWDIIFGHIKSNFRLLEAIIKNIIFVKKHVQSYDKLDPNIKLSLLSYIGLYTVIRFLEIDDTRTNNNGADYIDDSKDLTSVEIQRLYNRVVTGDIVLDRKAPKKFGNMVVVQWPISFDNLVPVKRLLDTGYIKGDIVFENITSQTEQMAISFKPFFNRTPEIQKFVNKLQKTILKENKPFSSINSMGNVLGKLCICYDFLGRKFKKEDFNWVLPIMDKLIQEEQPSLDGIVNDYSQLIHFGMTKGKAYYYVAGDYLNHMFSDHVVKNLITNIKSSKTFFEDLIDSYRKRRLDNIVYLYVLYIDKNKQRDLADMKFKNYEIYVDVMNYITTSINIGYTEKAKRVIACKNIDFINKLKEAMKKEIMSITKLPEAGKAERSISSELLKQLAIQKTEKNT